MAYSDYGGYAFRNGVRVDNRSDFTINPEVEGGGYGTPGQYPGFALLGGRASKDVIDKEIMRPNGHAVIGDAPVMVTLYKQSYIQAYRVEKGNAVKIDMVDALVDPIPAMWDEYNGTKYVDEDYFKANEKPAIFDLGAGGRLTVYFRIEDNHYCYAQLEQPDGVVWHGWSGYGVGAGLEDADYGFSTAERTERCAELFSTHLLVEPTTGAAA